MSVSGWFCDYLTLWVGLNVLFLWKPVYTAKKDLIDSLSVQAKESVRNFLLKVDSLIPKYREPVKRD